MKNIFYALICAVMLIGCNAQETSNDQKKIQLPAKEDILFITYYPSEELSEIFRSFEDRLKYSDAIIYGEITDYEMTVPEAHNICTFKKIHVIETLYGDIESDTDIQIIETGGYMLINDYLNSLDEEWKYSAPSEYTKLPDKEKKTKYISEVWDGYYYPEIGDRGVYCVKRSNYSDEFYRDTGAWQGKYREVEDGVLSKPDISNSYSDPNKTYIGDTIKYEDLKEQIQKAAEEHAWD